MLHSCEMLPKASSAYQVPCSYCTTVSSHHTDMHMNMDLQIQVGNNRKKNPKSFFFFNFFYCAAQFQSTIPDTYFLKERGEVVNYKGSFISTGTIKTRFVK